MAFKKSRVGYFTIGLAFFFVLFISACKIKPVDEHSLAKNDSFSNFVGITVKTGQPMPDFSLPDGEGKSVSLKQFRGKAPVMLLFYRGDWCPFCISQLNDLQNLLPALEEFGVQLLAISPDTVATTQNTARRFGQNYIFLSDEDRSLIDTLGIKNNKNLPHPAIFIVDQKGILRWYYANSDYKTRPTSDQMKIVLKQLFVERL
ncbi:MAG TPA: peroxiredoxin family protein [Pseudomonadales bacterium]